MNAALTVDAAVAVLVREQHGVRQVLLAERPPGKPWAGWWEFPGGKIEQGESALQALQRELGEELGTHALQAYPWLTRTFAYPDKTVKLHFFTVTAWQGEPHGKEGQQLSWQDPGALQVSPMLPANQPILQALALPAVYAISHVAEVGVECFLQQLQQALRNGLRLLQLREKQLDPVTFKSLARQVISLAHAAGAKVLLNADVALAAELGADGVHLTSAQLAQATEKPLDMLCAASCHTEQDVIQAQRLALDFVVVSPVLATLSHPDAKPLGWLGFQAMITDCSVPVYALGGMQPSDLVTAWQHGAHGIAMLRGAWGD